MPPTPLYQILELLLLRRELLGRLDVRHGSCSLLLGLLSLLSLLLLQGGELLLGGHLELSLSHGWHLVVLRYRIGEIVLNESVRFGRLKALERNLPRLCT